MTFAEVARLVESIRLGNDKREALSCVKDEKKACLYYGILFPNKGMLTKGDLSGRFAKEVGVFVDVLLDVVNEQSFAMALAQESNKSASQGWSVPQAQRMMEGVCSGALPIIETAHKMDEIEARLFWKHVLGEHAPLTPNSFLTCLGMNQGVHQDVMRRHIALKEPFALLEVIYNDPKSLDIPSRWYEETDIALTPRRYKPFLPYQDEQILKDYNGAVYQVIPQNGKTRMLYVLPEVNGTRLVWRDRAGRIDRPDAVPNVDWLPKGPLIMEVSLETDHRTGYTRLGVFDAIFPRYPHLTLQERLDKLHAHLKEHQENNRLKIEDDDWLYPDAPIIIHSLSGPYKISKLLSWGEDDEVRRFPDLGAFDPFKEGGYVLMKSLAKAILRLHSVRKVTGDLLEVELACIDGLDDFIPIGKVEVTGELKIASQGTLARLTNIVLNKDWQDIPPEVIIPMGVIVPEITQNPLKGENMMVTDIMDDLGISDITQYVDLLHGVA